jgi:hypothetical protein
MEVYVLQVIVLICLWFSIMEFWLGVKLHRPGTNKTSFPGGIGRKILSLKSGEMDYTVCAAVLLRFKCIVFLKDIFTNSPFFRPNYLPLN